MELTGLQIFKYLPAAKKQSEANCKNCGFPTCMAYALKLAKKQADIESCPYVPEELKEKFSEALKIQQHEVTISETLKTGGETVMYRHDKTFVNPTVIAVELSCEDLNFDEKLKKIADYKTERVGQIFKTDAISLKGSTKSEAYRIAAKKAKAAGLALLEDDTENYSIIKGSDSKSLSINAENFLKTSKKHLILELEIENKSIKQILEELTIIRRAAIVQRYEPLTYPVAVKMPANLDPLQACALGSFLICRYANIIVLTDEQGLDYALLSTLLTLRQSIYTNPQKPLQVEAKVYEFNEPDENSPILLTTNFALTYFAVAGELEQLPFGSYLVVTPSDGMSVLTAWSADKFTAELVAKSVKNYDLINKVKTRSIIIPGLLSHMKDELQEAMPEWNIIVGTIEACQIPEFLKEKENR